MGADAGGLRGGRRGSVPPDRDAIVIGGGVIGLSIAWRAAQRGLAVTILDPEPGTGASRAAAGMLAPVAEVSYTEEPLLRLSLVAAERYPSFVEELADASGLDPGYRRCGTLAAGLDADDAAELDELFAFQTALKLPVERLSGRDCRILEPLLAPGVTGGLLVPGDHQIDSRRLVAALLAALSAGQPTGSPGGTVELRRERAAGLLVEADRAVGVTLPDGSALRATSVVLAAGWASRVLPGLPAEVAPPVRPVKGQILRLRMPQVYAGAVSRTLRGLARGTSVYLVPRTDGELVIGATVEERADTTVTAGAVYELLRAGQQILPLVAELPLVETSAALRPGSPDNAPLIGPTALPGLVVATGHYRNGILLAPVTADAVAQYLATGAAPAVVEAFRPDRFRSGRVGESTRTT